MSDIQKLKYDLAMRCAQIKVAALYERKEFKTDREFFNAMLDEFTEFCRGISNIDDTHFTEALECLRSE